MVQIDQCCSLLFSAQSSVYDLETANIIILNYNTGNNINKSIFQTSEAFFSSKYIIFYKGKNGRTRLNCTELCIH
jgi:hypothetical protein